MLADTYIQNLYVRGVRHFSKLQVTFNSGFNFIAGPNGCGKTSILTCISHCFSGELSFAYSRFQDGADFWVDCLYDKRAYRIGIRDLKLRSTAYREKGLKTWDSPRGTDGLRIVPAYDVNDTNVIQAPLFIGADRSIKYQAVNGMAKEAAIDEFRRLHLAKTSQSIFGDKKSTVKQWLINRYFIVEKEWAVEETVNWKHLISGIQALGPFNSDFKFVKIERDMEPVFSIYGRECYLEELSGGFQAILSIIVDIFEWVEGNRPEGQKSVSEAHGSVIIDELDIHLHPEWQFTLRAGLRKLFPHLQFIVTTHSPHLLASAGPNEVIQMPAMTVEEPLFLEPSHGTFSGWTTDQILEDVMGVVSIENKEYARMVGYALDVVETGDVKALEEAINQLAEVAHPNDTIISVLKIKLASLELVSE
jgi:energy-coupling factor transporter ATP-binding protein EcfA2